MPAGKASLLIIFITVFIDLLGFGIVLPLLPRYGKHFEAVDWQLGLLMSCFSAMQFLFAPLWGRLSDRIGRRPVLILGLSGSTVSYALVGYATGLGGQQTWLGLGTLAWLFVSRIGAGIAGATIPTAQAYIADVTGSRDRAKGMALIGAAFGIGFTFGPLLGAAFVSDDPGHPPSAMPGYVAAALSFVATLCAVFVLKESRQPGSESAGRHGLFALGNLGRGVMNPATGLVLLTMFLVTFAFAEFESTLSLLTRELGLSQRDNFYVFAYIGLILALSQGMIVRRLVPKVGPFRMSVAGTALMTIGLLAIGWSTGAASRGLLYALLPIAVMGFSASTPSLQAMLSLRSSSEVQGEVLGLGQSVSALARILGPMAGIMIFERHGMSMTCWVAAGVMAIGLLAVLTLRNPAEEARATVGTTPEVGTTSEQKV